MSKHINISNNLSARQIIRLFVWICIYRLTNAWMIRTQFDPDEYWQTLEPAYCLVFGSTGQHDDIINNGYSTINEGRHVDDYQRIHGCALTWEWTRRWTPPPASSSTATIQSTPSSAKIMSQAVQNMMQQALHGPVRSYVSILPTYWYYLSCRSLFQWAEGEDFDTRSNNNDNATTKIGYLLKQFLRRNATHLISKGPVYLHAILVAAPTDLSVYLIASRMNNNLQNQNPITKDNNSLLKGSYWTSSWPFWALVCSITSWFHGYALVRTYANSVETVCLLVGMALLGPELFGQSRSTQNGVVNNNPLRYHHSPLRAKLAFILGGLSACVRFTSLAAWIPVGLIVTFRSSGIVGRRSFTSMRKLMHMFGLCVTYGLVGVILGCCIDRWFYGFWAIPFLGNIHFNVLLGHGSLYGTHPLLWYAYAGIPAICGAMLPFFLWEIFTINTDPQLALLLGVIIPYIALHSFSEHKEFRFLLPILPLVCILAGHAICRLVQVTDEAANYDSVIGSSNGRRVKAPLKSSFTTSPKLLLVLLIILNYPHLFYLSLIHQRGPIAVNRYLASAIDKKTRQVSQNDDIQQYSIHYLMGCHSAPLYSYLHIPNVRVNAWNLDCSPTCRSDPEVICESDAFSNDPMGFVMSAYGNSVDGGCTEEVVVKEPPSFLVAMQDDAADIENVLTEKLNMSHVASIRHAVKFISWHIPNHHGAPSHDQCPNNEKCHDVVTMFSCIDIHYDHMEIYVA